MKTATILSSWENAQDVSRANLIFENRNKNYGGYFIRVYYPDRIFRAFFFAVLGFGLTVIGLVMAGKLLIATGITIPQNDVADIIYFPPSMPSVPPEIKPYTPPGKSGTSSKWTIPVAVDSTVEADTTVADAQANNTRTGNTSTIDSGDVMDNGNHNSLGANTSAPVLIAEEMPEFSGGESKLFEHLRNNIKYPVRARENNTQGYVYLSFIVDKTGKINDVKLLRGIGDGCDEEALRVVKKMPDSRPGKNNGVPVAVQYNLPINFKLK